LLSGEADISVSVEGEEAVGTGFATEGVRLFFGAKNDVIIVVQKRGGVVAQDMVVDSSPLM
jgi:hypothetical protein